MSGPSDEAVRAAARAHFTALHFREPSHLEVATHGFPEALAAAHDPALGLDRSVCLRDVVEWLKREAKPSGECGLFPERLVEMCEREFGGGAWAS